MCKKFLRALSLVSFASLISYAEHTLAENLVCSDAYIKCYVIGWHKGNNKKTTLDTYDLGSKSDVCAGEGIFPHKCVPECYTGTCNKNSPDIQEEVQKCTAYTQNYPPTRNPTFWNTYSKISGNLHIACNEAFSYKSTATEFQVTEASFGTAQK